MKPDTIEERPVTLSEVKGELAKIKERDKELNFRANRLEEYLTMFTTLEEKKAEEMSKKINALDISRLKDVHICKIIDIMPKNVEELKVVLQGYNVSINNDALKKIVGIVSEYMPKSK